MFTPSKTPSSFTALSLSSFGSVFQEGAGALKKTWLRPLLFCYLTWLLLKIAEGLPCQARFGSFRLRWKQDLCLCSFCRLHRPPSYCRQVHFKTLIEKYSVCPLNSSSFLWSFTTSKSVSYFHFLFLTYSLKFPEILCFAWSLKAVAWHMTWNCRRILSLYFDHFWRPVGAPENPATYCAAEVGDLQLYQAVNF